MRLQTRTSSERVLASACRKGIAGARCRRCGMSVPQQRGHRPASDSGSVPASVPGPDGEGSPATANAAGGTENRLLVCIKLVGAWYLCNPFFFSPLPIRWNLSQSSKVMEMAQKTGRRCNCRSSLSLGNGLKTPRMIGEMAPRPLIRWPFTLQVPCLQWDAEDVGIFPCS